jgi:NADH dehydrogenase/NADH:ubiquinone oxidoreductase subunit G
LEKQNLKIKEKSGKIRELEGENRTLRRALESFLRLDVLKGISNLGKTLLERFNVALEHVKTVLATPKPEIERKLEHKQEERTETKPTPIVARAVTKEEPKAQETPPPTQQYTRNNSGGREH